MEVEEDTSMPTKTMVDRKRRPHKMTAGDSFLPDLFIGGAVNVASTIASFPFGNASTFNIMHHSVLQDNHSGTVERRLLFQHDGY